MHLNFFSFFVCTVSWRPHLVEYAYALFNVLAQRKPTKRTTTSNTRKKNGCLHEKKIVFKRKILRKMRRKKNTEITNDPRENYVHCIK